MDVDHHLIDEGYGTQMEIDVHSVGDESEAGGAKLEQAPADTAESSGGEASNSSSHLPPPHSGLTTAEFAEIVVTAHYENYDPASVPIQPLPESGSATAEPPLLGTLEDGESQSLELNIALSAHGNQDTLDYVVDEDDDDAEPNSGAGLVSDDAGSLPSLPDADATPTVHIPSFFSQLNPTDPILLVPDRGHVHSFSRFLWNWNTLKQLFHVNDRLTLQSYSILVNQPKPFLRAEDVARCDGDIQGIHWAQYGLTRWKARSARRRLYCMQSTIRHRCDICSNFKGVELSNNKMFFNFHQLSTGHIPTVEHWQLRNLLTMTSQNDMFYAAGHQVKQINPYSQTSRNVVNLDSPLVSTYGSGFNTTCLTSGDGFLIAGSFQGEYVLVDLTSEYMTRQYRHRLTSDEESITNHVHLYNSRSSGRTHALFASNDRKLRTLDCNTNQITRVQSCPIVNCAATSPDGRLRIQVGDFPGSEIVDPDSGRSLKHIHGNTGDSFACAWADDGYTVAVAGQDSHVLIFDARNWSAPLADITSELDCTRSLTFSPVGGGKKVLVAAESADYVNIIDATTFDSKQTIDFFGNIAGVCFSPDGSELLVGNADHKIGGIFTFRRPERRAEAEAASRWLDRTSDAQGDWLSFEEQESDPRVLRRPSQQRYISEYEDIVF